jgi:hypothetical protein
MRLIGLTVLLLLLSVSAQAQAPTKENAAALLKDAQAELAEARKALAESPVYQRFARAERLVAGLKAFSEPEKKPETASK